MMWGARKEGGFWIVITKQWRVLWRNHDAIYIAAGRLRLRIMKSFNGR